MHPSFDAAFYKILNAIGDICERTCCDKVLILELEIPFREVNTTKCYIKSLMLTRSVLNVV